MRIITYGSFFVHLLGLLVFCYGFFPKKKAVLDGYAQRQDINAPAVFDRLVFIVIDALRSDFAFAASSKMLRLQELIGSGEAMPFTAKASTPTVTLPRLKCLTTGSIAGFLDAILNIAESDDSSTIATQDSWVKQHQLSKRRIHMYGDDTWLRLFPDAFSAYEGTSSFLVSDFTEVDNNVTRHLDTELQNPTWDALILHYLGLDHIGHLQGPDSVHMPAKQEEMDNIVSRIYDDAKAADALDGKSTLIIVAGDHGMTGDGNHGGASDPEVYTAIAMVAQSFTVLSQNITVPPAIPLDSLRFHDQIIQSDIVPSLSLLLGLPIPQNSVGIVPYKVLKCWTSQSDRRAVLRQNASQLQKLLKAGHFTLPSIITDFACEQSTQEGSCTLSDVDFASRPYDTKHSAAEEEEEEYYRLMQMMQETLLSSSNDYNMPAMHLGLSLLLLALLAILVLVNVPLYRMQDILGTLIMPLIHGMSAFASSFIEEEQVLWYFLASFGLSIISLQGLRSAQSYVKSLSPLLGSLGCFRLLRRFNQTGQKYAGASDISSILRQIPHWDTVLVLSLALSLLLPTLTRANLKASQKIIMIAAITSLTLFKAPLLSDVSVFAKFTWVWTCVECALTMFVNPQSSAIVSHLLSSLLFALQSRPRNYPILALFFGINHQLKKGKNVRWSVSIYFAMQQASFYAMGNSNSLAGLDLSQAYNGVSSYSETSVGLLLFFSTFVGPIFWQISLINWLNQRETPKAAKGFARILVVQCSCIYSLALCVSCYTLRHHLFVYSVFSPRLLYAVAWTLFYAGALLSIQ